MGGRVVGRDGKGGRRDGQGDRQDKIMAGGRGKVAGWVGRRQGEMKRRQAGRKGGRRDAKEADGMQRRQTGRKGGRRDAKEAGGTQRRQEAFRRCSVWGLPLPHPHPTPTATLALAPNLNPISLRARLSPHLRYPADDAEYHFVPRPPRLRDRDRRAHLGGWVVVADLVAGGWLLAVGG